MRAYKNPEVDSSTSTSTGTQQTGGPGNGDRIAMLNAQGANLNQPGGEEVTPAVVYANTSASNLGSGADDLGAQPGKIYEITFDMPTLMRWGKAFKFDEMSPVGDISGSTDYLEVNGQEVDDKGAASFLMYAGGKVGYPEITVRAANNGLLCLMRLARSMMEMGSKYGADEDSGYTVDPGTNLEVMCAMRMGNAVRGKQARSDGHLAGIDPHELVSRVNRLITATAAAAMAYEAGPVDAKKYIDETDIVGRRYRKHDRENFEGVGWSDETKGKLAQEANGMFRDRPGRKPVTYVPDAMDFSEAIDELFSSVGGLRSHNSEAEVEFLERVEQTIKDSVDLSFLDNTDPGFKKRFEAHWKQAIEDAFEGADLARLRKERAKLPVEKRYTSRRVEHKEPTATVHHNSEGKADGTGEYAMPDFSGWGLEPLIEPEQEASGSETGTDASTDQQDGSVREQAPVELDPEELHQSDYLALKSHLKQATGYRDGKRRGLGLSVDSKQGWLYAQLSEQGKELWRSFGIDENAQLAEANHLLQGNRAEIRDYIRFLDAWSEYELARSRGEDGAAEMEELRAEFEAFQEACADGVNDVRSVNGTLQF